MQVFVSSWKSYVGLKVKNGKTLAFISSFYWRFMSKDIPTFRKKKLRVFCFVSYFLLIVFTYSFNNALLSSVSSIPLSTVNVMHRLLDHNQGTCSHEMTPALFASPSSCTPHLHSWETAPGPVNTTQYVKGSCFNMETNKQSNLKPHWKEIHRL